MDRISLSDAKARLSEPIVKVEAGQAVEITRRGKPSAQLIGVDRPRRKIDVAALRALTAAMRPCTQEANEVVRAMRDDDRY